MAEKTVFGMAGTGDWTHPDYRPKNYRQMAFKLFPDSPTPFTKMLSKLPTKTVTDPEFKIYEERLPAQWATSDGIVASSVAKHDIDVVTLNIGEVGGSTPSYAFKIGDLLKGETGGEVVRVTEITDATNIKVSRYWGDTGTAGTSTILDNEVLRWVGSAYPEGDGAPKAISKQPTIVTNFTQIFKDTAGITGTAQATTFRPDAKQWPVLQAQCLERHMLKLESALIHGVKEEVLIQNARGESEYARSTGGFRQFVWDAGYYKDYAGAVTLDAVEDRLERVFTYGSKTKGSWVGYRALNVLNKLVRANSTWNWNAEAMPKKQTYGLEVMELRCPFGVLQMIPHPLMAESVEYTSEMYIFDSKNLEYVTLPGRDTDWFPNAQNVDEDAKRGYYQSECGLRLALPETHEVWTGMTAVA